MTLDEAIEHAEGVASNCEGECADEHRQLAEWLRELKEWKKLAGVIDIRPASLMVPFRPNVNDLERENEELKAENERLRSERDHWHARRGAQSMEQEGKMSMLTEQVARLRKTAKAYEDVAAPNTAALLREAADTIEDLRGRLTETAKRESVDGGECRCSKCGYQADSWLWYGFAFCPSCGRRMVG